jgi:hypothetical protein
MSKKPVETKFKYLTWNSVAQLVFTAVFFFWVSLIWNSSADLSNKLNAATERYTAVHDLQVEFKSEVQEWKNLLLRSTNRDTLDKNWNIFETQYQKVASAAQLIVVQNDERNTLSSMNSFTEAHAANHELYKKSLDTLVRSNYDPRPADASVKGVDRPLLDHLEAAEKSMQEEKRRSNDNLMAKARAKIEQSLFALGFIGLLAIWMPR